MSGSPVPSVYAGDGYEQSDEIIGRGAFSVVYRGRHRLTGQPVAIKVFKDTDETRFLHTVKCFERIAGTRIKSRTFRSEVSSLSPPQPESEMASIRNESVRSIAAASFKPSKEVAHQLRLALVAKELVVSLLDYSRGSDGKSPGKENGEFFMVMELGDISLEQYIEYRANNGKPFTVEEIRTILYDVTRMVCLLHSQGLAHLDVKPANIMLFNSTFWKLIDFDGCFRAASLVDVNQSDIAFTPLYCAPELAAVIVKMASQLKISRLMDVWSVGAIGAELVLLKPLFEARYSMMYDSQNNDDSEFLRWLCDLSQPVLAPRDSEKLMKVNDELRSLVEELLLVKDVKQRASLLEVLKHPFFGNMGPRQCWSVPAATNPHESSKARILTLNANELSIDPANPLESDDAGALVHDSSADDEEHNPGLSPAEITPMISPQPKGRNTILRFVCCK